MQRSIVTPRTSVIWSLTPYIAISAIHVGAILFQSPIASPTKLLLMPLLALAVLVAAPHLRPRSATALLVAGLAASWLGDGAGTFFPWAPEVPMMLLFFGLAHIAYMILFAKHLRIRRIPVWAVVYIAWWAGMLIVLGPHTGDLFFAIAAYGLVLGGTAALAACCNRVIMWGGVFFLISDTVLAFRLFTPDLVPANWGSPLIMATYTLGQGLIIAGAIVALRRRAA